MKNDLEKISRLVEALDEAWPENEQEQRQELRAAGLDPGVVRARMRAAAAEAMSSQDSGQQRRELRQPLPLPWVRKVEGSWICDPAMASQSRDQRSYFKLDFSQGSALGSVRLLIYLRSQADGSRALHVEWNANFNAENGWSFELYRIGEDQPLFVRNLGPGLRGSAYFSNEDLCLDPAATPLNFSFGPDTSHHK